MLPLFLLYPMKVAIPRSAGPVISRTSSSRNWKKNNKKSKLPVKSYTKQNELDMIRLNTLKIS